MTEIEIYATTRTKMSVREIVFGWRGGGLSVVCCLLFWFWKRPVGCLPKQIINLLATLVDLGKGQHLQRKVATEHCSGRSGKV